VHLEPGFQQGAAGVATDLPGRVEHEDASTSHFGDLRSGRENQRPGSRDRMVRASRSRDKDGPMGLIDPPMAQ
jgi:hypothetical protein